MLTGEGPTSVASTVSVLAILATSAVAALASILVPRLVRRARVRAMELEPVEEHDPTAREGSYRERPPPPQLRVNPSAARAATVAVAVHGSSLGVVLALAVSYGGLVLKFAGGHPGLVTMLFVVSWALLASHAPDEDRFAGAVRAKPLLATFLAAAAVLGCLFLWHQRKAKSDWADALTARASSAVATIEARQQEEYTTCGQSGCDDHEYYVVDYHLSVAGARYAGSTRQGRCYQATSDGGTAAAIYDPANPSQNLLSCARDALVERDAEHVALLLAGVGVSILVTIWVSLARARSARRDAGPAPGEGERYKSVMRRHGRIRARALL